PEHHGGPRRQARHDGLGLQRRGRDDPGLAAVGIPDDVGDRRGRGAHHPAGRRVSPRTIRLPWTAWYLLVRADALGGRAWTASMLRAGRADVADLLAHGPRCGGRLEAVA